MVIRVSDLIYQSRHHRNQQTAVAKRTGQTRPGQQNHRSPLNQKRDFVVEG